MAPASKTLSIWRGNTKTFVFRMKQSDGTAVDLTGATVVLTIIHDAGRIVKSSASGGIVIDDPTSGEVKAPLTTAETRSVKSEIRGATYELEVKTDAEETTVLTGKIDVQGGGNDD